MSRYDKMQLGVRSLPRGYRLPWTSALQLLHAERFARSLQQPMTHAVTINFTRPLKPGISARDVFIEIRNKVQRAWNYRRRKGAVSDPLYYLAVFENPPFGRRFGRAVYGPLHVHWMIHWYGVPTTLIEQIANRVLRKYSQGVPRDAIDITSLYKPVGYVMYMCKGIDPPYAKHYHIQHRPQGFIPFKRISISNRLGDAAMKKYAELHGIHPFTVANSQRTKNAWRFTGKRRRNRMKRQRPWRGRTYMSVNAVSRTSPQPPTP